MASRRQVWLTMALGVISLLAGWAAHLALTDIYHGEADTRLEWNTVRIAALIIFVFIAMALVTLGQTLRTGGRMAGAFNAPSDEC